MPGARTVLQTALALAVSASSLAAFVFLGLSSFEDEALAAEIIEQDEVPMPRFDPTLRPVVPALVSPPPPPEPEPELEPPEKPRKRSKKYARGY